MTPRFVGIDVCPYCHGTDIVNKEDRSEADAERAEEEGTPEDIICRDVWCENCGRGWTIEFRPISYLTYDGGPQKDAFNPDRKVFQPATQTINTTRHRGVLIVETVLGHTYNGSDFYVSAAAAASAIDRGRGLPEGITPEST